MLLSSLLSFLSRDASSCHLRCPLLFVPFMSFLSVCWSRWQAARARHHSLQDHVTSLHVNWLLRVQQYVALRLGGASLPDTAPFIGTTWTNKTADAIKALWAQQLGLPASADWASFARTLINNGFRTSPPHISAVRAEVSAPGRVFAVAIRRDVASLSSVISQQDRSGISEQDRSDLSRLLLELSLSLGAPSP